MQRHLLEEMLSLLRPPLCLARRSDQAVHNLQLLVLYAFLAPAWGN